MLKIKDNVELKELEKFGFSECGRVYFDDNSFIMIYKNTREISIVNASSDMLYDLIQAGLVEKVVEV